MGNGWYKVSTAPVIVKRYRSGLRGTWDAAWAFLSGGERPTVDAVYVGSAFIKGDGAEEIVAAWGMHLERRDNDG